MDKRNYKICTAELIHTIRLHTDVLRKPLILKVARELFYILREPDFTGRWNKKSTQLFYIRMGIIDDNGAIKCEEDEQFLCNVALSWMLKSLSNSSELRVSYWPQVRLKSRQYLAIEYNQFDFEHLLEFHRLVQELVNYTPNYGTSQNDICARLVLSLIGIDGVVIANADGRISDVEKKMIHLEYDMPMIQIAMSRKKGSQTKQFYLGDYSLRCMKILYPRAQKQGPIFPGGWLMTDAHHKKRDRRIYLEQFLASLWCSAYPERPVPEYLDVEFWGRASRLSMVLNGVPFVCLADLRNRIRGAQVPVLSEAELPIKLRTSEPENLLEGVQSFDWLRTLHSLVRKYDDSGMEKLTLGQVNELPGEFEMALAEGECSGACREDEVTLARWLIWMLRQKHFQKMRLSTFQGYISSIINRVLPLPSGKPVKEMNVDDWKSALRDLACNEDYMPSSRRTAITHMRVLNEYLHNHEQAPKIDFSDYEYRVPRASAECEVIFPHDVDDIINSVENENMKVALILAFYCGMRCEEICFLSVEGMLDEYRLLVGRSKLATSRRTFPYVMFVPETHMDYLREIIQKRLDAGAFWMITDGTDKSMSTWKLSKQVGRLLKASGARVKKMHGLRHGFASWQFVRYFMLVDKRFREDLRVGRFHLDLDGRHPWFGDQMLAQFAEVMGGILWRCSFEEEGRCHGNATDMILISKQMGHASRFTTLENYTNTLGWVSRYYLRRREQKLISS